MIGDILVLSGVGAFTGLALSFTALSPLVMGGIIGLYPWGLYLACGLVLAVNEEDTASNKLKVITGLSMYTAASAAIGVGLAAAAISTFPGVMLGAGSMALAGALIGTIAPVAAEFLNGQVNSHIISPIIEHFSSKEKGYQSV